MGTEKGSVKEVISALTLAFCFASFVNSGAASNFVFICDLVSKVGGKHRDSIKTHEIAKLCAERLRAGDDVETVRSLAAPQLLIDNKSKGCSFACRARPSSWLAKTFGKTFDQMRFPSRR